MLARIPGARVSAIVGISVVAIGGSIGIPAGLLAGYRRGWVDAVIARIIDVQLAFPLGSWRSRSRRWSVQACRR